MASNKFQGMGGHIRARVQSLYQHTVNRVVTLCNPHMLTLTINEYQAGGTRNHVFEAADTFLNTKASPTTMKKGLELSCSEKDERINISVNKRCQYIEDDFEGIKLTWRLVVGKRGASTNPQKSASTNPNSRTRPMPYIPYVLESDVGFLQHAAENVDDESPTKFELSFEDKHYQKVVESYIPYILKRAKELKDENKTLKIYGPHYGGGIMLGPYGGGAGYGGGGQGAGVSLTHASTFQTLAMDDDLKKDIIEDLDRFVNRRDYYKSVGKAWKRCYLIHGPSRTGKSSLVAAMANHLNFDVYDLDHTSVHSNSHFRNVLLGTKNRSIILVDCSAKLGSRGGYGSYHNPYAYQYPRTDINVTLSGLLDAVDGLWSCCGDERIIIFVTNNKDGIEPALLLPGRIDKQIHMSYVTPEGFRILASNYLSIDKHHLFGEIDELIRESQTTPGELTEALMISDDPDVSLNGLIELLKKKITEEEEVRKIIDDEARQKDMYFNSYNRFQAMPPGCSITPLREGYQNPQNSQIRYEKLNSSLQLP